MTGAQPPARRFLERIRCLQSKRVCVPGRAKLMSSRLVAFLEREHPGATVSVDSYAQIHGGHSRLTARFRAEIDGRPQWMAARATKVSAPSANESKEHKE